MRHAVRVGQGDIIDDAEQQRVAILRDRAQPLAVAGDPRQPRKQPLHDGKLAPRHIELLRHRFQTVHPAAHIQQIAKLVAELVEARIEEVVIGVADIAAEPPLADQLVLDWRAVIRDHPAERRRGAPITDDRTQEIEILPHHLEGGRRLEQHEAECEIDA